MAEIRIIDNASRPAGDELRESLEWASHVRIATAFAKGSGVSRLLDSFRRVLSDGGELRVVYGLDFHITDPQAIEQFRRLADDYPSTVIHRAYSEWGLALSQAFHPKLYICTGATGDAQVLTGSSNLTQGGLWDNFEVNTVITGTSDDPVILHAYSIFDRAFTHEHCFVPTQEYVDAYRELYRRAAAVPLTASPPERLMAAYEELKGIADRRTLGDCPRHAGQQNSGNREHLDGQMMLLPMNQAGLGRHKCSYCAYEQAYWQAIDDIQSSLTQGWTTDIPRSQDWSPNIDCPRHAGQQNSGNREHLDGQMMLLPMNQAGRGRHKCPYCAYERGYWQAIDDLRNI